MTRLVFRSRERRQSQTIAFGFAHRTRCGSSRTWAAAVLLWVGESEIWGGPASFLPYCFPCSNDPPANRAYEILEPGILGEQGAGALRPFMNCAPVVICLVLACAGSTSFAQKSSAIDSPQHKAWDLLLSAILLKRTSERTNGVQALGLLPDTKQARDLAENGLKDASPDVRKLALRQMRAMQSISKLEDALSDPKIPVVMAAAQSLRELKQDGTAYEVYYEMLMGERKRSDGVIAQQLETLKNPKELAKIGFAEGIGYIPFAGIGWDAYRTMHKKDPNPARAVAAPLLAHDPDPEGGKALVKATDDQDWIVRAAAVKAIAERGDRSLLPHVVDKFTDRNPNVRYSAAAAVIRLTGMEDSKTARNDR